MALELTVMSLDFDAGEGTKTETYDKVELQIGRDPSNDVVLTGEAVSGIHASITCDSSGDTARIFVTDLGSTNGTLIDSKRLTPNEPFQLESHQRIIIGEYLIKPSMIAELANQSLNPESSNDDTSSIEEQKPDIRIIKGGKILNTIEETEQDAEAALDDIAESFDDYEDSAASVEIQSPVIDLQVEVERPVKNTSKKKKAKNKEVPMENTAYASTPLESSGADTVKAVVSAETIEFNLVAKKLVALCGTVLHKGTPLAGVTIHAGDLGSVTTNADGEFSLDAVVEGTEFEVELEKDSFSFDGDTFTGTIEEGGELVFQATELFTISGIIAHKGEPLVGVTVNGGALGTTTTDSDGRYEFTDVAEGTEISITAIKDGYIFEVA